jgi:ribosomal protein S18 acetylase RimI-like enzyme
VTYASSYVRGPEHGAIAIRLARDGDLGFVRTLSAEAFATYGDYSGVLPAWLGDPAVQTLLAELPGESAVGFAMLGPRRPHRLLAMPGGELLALAVAPHQRHRGVGRRLLLEVEHCARAARMRELWLSTATSNVPARRLYSSAGFTVRTLDRRRYPSGHVALEMAKRL